MWTLLVRPFWEEEVGGVLGLEEVPDKFLGWGLTTKETTRCVLAKHAQGIEIEHVCMRVCCSLHYIRIASRFLGHVFSLKPPEGRSRPSYITQPCPSSHILEREFEDRLRSTEQGMTWGVEDSLRATYSDLSVTQTS